MMMLKTIQSESYHADDVGLPAPSLSNSIAQLLLVNPRKAWLAHPRLNPNYRTDNRHVFNTGTAAHDLFLEGGTGKIEVIDPELYPAKNGNIPNGWTNDAIRTARDDAYAIGKTPILKAEYAEIEYMAQAAHKGLAECPELNGLSVAEGQPEGTLTWTEDNGVHCRIRIDLAWLDAGVLLDYKTTDIPSPGAWRRGMSGRGNPFQAAFYTRGVQKALGIESQMVFMTQETEYPYDCYFTGCAPSKLAVAMADVERSIALFGKCLKEGFHGYDKHIVWEEAAQWEIAAAEEAAYESGGLSLFDKDAPGAKENFLFGRVKDEHTI